MNTNDTKLSENDKLTTGRFLAAKTLAFTFPGIFASRNQCHSLKIMRKPIFSQKLDQMSNFSCAIHFVYKQELLELQIQIWDIFSIKNFKITLKNQIFSNSNIRKMKKFQKLRRKCIYQRTLNEAKWILIWEKKIGKNSIHYS